MNSKRQVTGRLGQVYKLTFVVYRKRDSKSLYWYCIYVFPKALERLAGISLNEPLFIDVTADQITGDCESKAQTEVQVSKSGGKVTYVICFFA